MKLTKKMLDMKVAMLELELTKAKDTIKLQEMQLAALKQFSLGGLTSSIVIAAEKVCDAAAHVTSDALKLRSYR